MARGELSRGLRRAVDSFGSLPRPQCDRTTRPARWSLHPATSRCLSTTASRRSELVSSTPEKFTAAPPIKFEPQDGGKKHGGKINLRSLRVVPASPSYFSAKPTFTDDFISLQALLRTVATLPTVSPAEAPKVAWKTIDQYRIMTNEPVKTLRFHKMVHILRRLNCIHPSLMPKEVSDAMQRYKKPTQPGDIEPAPGIIDELGRAKGVGRRKTSSAVAWIVEGEGECLINGKSLAQFFGRLHDRESAVWALKSTQRLDKYNVWGLVTGGGVTGQAEALTLAVAKALLVHEPALKPALRRGESEHPVFFNFCFLFFSCGSVFLRCDFCVFVHVHVEFELDPHARGSFHRSTLFEHLALDYRNTIPQNQNTDYCTQPVVSPAILER
jgi:small subunit ribosomal protein S9